MPSSGLNCQAFRFRDVRWWRSRKLQQQSSGRSFGVWSHLTLSLAIQTRPDGQVNKLLTRFHRHDGTKRPFRMQQSRDGSQQFIPVQRIIMSRQIARRRRRLQGICEPRWVRNDQGIAVTGLVAPDTAADRMKSLTPRACSKVFCRLTTRRFVNFNCVYICPRVSLSQHQCDQSGSRPDIQNVL